MLAAFVVLLVAGLLGVIGNLIHAVVGSLLMMLAMVGFAAVVLVLLAGASYLAWRDTFSDAASPPPVAHVHGFEGLKHLHPAKRAIQRRLHGALHPQKQP